MTLLNIISNANSAKTGIFWHFFSMQTNVIKPIFFLKKRLTDQSQKKLRAFLIFTRILISSFAAKFLNLSTFFGLAKKCQKMPKKCRALLL